MRRYGTRLMAVLLTVTLARWLPLPPPPPPPDPQAGIRSAPVPDLDVRGPAVAPSTSPEIEPKMFRGSDSMVGAGFLPGSRFQSEEDRRVITTPGLNVRMPIQ